MTMTDDDKRIFQRRAAEQSPSADRNASGAPAAGVEDDPLAELIRIVKEEDPFGDLLNDPMPGAAPSAQPPAKKPAVSPPQRATAPSAAATSSEGEPPPLDPVDLDQALRDFRDAPEEVLRRDTSWMDGGLDAAEIEAAPLAGPVDPYQDPAFTDIEASSTSAYAAEDEDIEMMSADDTYEREGQYAEADGQQRPRRGTFVAVGALLGLVVLAAAAGYVYTQVGGSSANEGPLPIIRADSQPVKVAPDDPGGAEIPNQDRLVYNRVSGETAEPETKLVSREEEILGPPNGTAKEEARFSADGAAEEMATGTTSAASDSSAAEPGSLAPLAATSPPANGIAPVPRRVKTVVVRPDGSIVSIEPQEPTPAPSAAPTQTAAADIPVPPSRPAPAAAPAPTREPVRLASTSSDASPPPVPPVQPTRAAPSAPPPSNAPLALNPQAAQQQAEQPAGSQRVARAAPDRSVQPQSRTWFTAVPSSPPAAAAAPAPTTSPAPSAGTDTRQYVVQLAARRNEEQANEAYNTLKAQYAGLLGRYQPLIQRADLGERGVYYRVRVGPMASAEAAKDVCEQLKTAGLPDCLVRPR